MSSRAKYIMIGGFLGAGKTTSVIRLARYLSDQGQRVGIIMNDQGAGLVDTALAEANQFPTEEISGGCFCCRFNSLIEAAQHLTDDTRPDVIISEPVGSCTDLVATVSLPLQQIYGEQYDIAPLSVVVDPIRARRVLGLDTGKKFSPNVIYIYKKQLEEAGVIIINKTDLVSAEELQELSDALEKNYPRAKVVRVAARHGHNLSTWFDHVASTSMAAAPTMEVDYQLYGEGEALLGWLNVTAQLEELDGNEVDGNALLQHIAAELRSQLAAQGAEIAHLKMILSADPSGLELAAINCTRTDAQPELSHTLADPIDSGELLINLRAEAAPEVLDAAVSAALAGLKTQNIQSRTTHSEHFRPGQPVPTHRVVV
ncbi:MAG: cobalamin biosynthesis protein P47K [Verrucomicrobiaceae bacterium]|nr:cobalamin biosynthesis protein P47K [Verrucomicrobiaceae bacterium]